MRIQISCLLKQDERENLRTDLKRDMSSMLEAVVPAGVLSRLQKASVNVKNVLRKCDKLKIMRVEGFRMCVLGQTCDDGSRSVRRSEGFGVRNIKITGLVRQEQDKTGTRPQTLCYALVFHAALSVFWNTNTK